MRALLLTLSIAAAGMHCSGAATACAETDAGCDLLTLYLATYAPLIVGAGQIAGPPNVCGVVLTSGANYWPSAQTISGCLDLLGAAIGPGKIVVGGRTTTECALYATTDGGTWSGNGCPGAAASSISEVAYGNGIFVAVGDDGASAPLILTSSDGYTWTTAPNGSATQIIRTVNFINGYFYMGEGGGGAGNLHRSVNPSTVTIAALNGTNIGGGFRYHDVIAAAGGGVLAITDQNGTRYAADGVNFSTGTIFSTAPAGERPQGVATNGALNVAVGGEIGGTESCYVSVSSDGLNWGNEGIMASACAGNSGIAYDVIYGSGEYIATSSTTTGFLMRSSSGLPGSWSAVDIGLTVIRSLEFRER